MFHIRYSIRVLLIVLIVLSVINLIALLLDKRDVTLVEKTVRFLDSKNDSRQLVMPRADEIGLNFKIQDISRIDISCEYIVRDLAQKISKLYRNKRRYCSKASLRNALDSTLKNSVLYGHKDEVYMPVFNLTNQSGFEPFAFDTPAVQSVAALKTLQPGGSWSPNHLDASKACSVDNLEHIAFIVPFSKDRIGNLKLFLLNIHAYLQTAEFKFKYTMIVAEQNETNGMFNKGRLLNAAFFHVTTKYPDIDCVVIHDVDLVPAHDSRKLKERGDYRCRQMPWHMTNKVYLMANQSPRVYNNFLTGGILSLRPNHFIDSNGFSNKFFGWGAEDDDFTLRMLRTHLCIMRPARLETLRQDAPFVMLPHAPSKRNNGREHTLLDSFWSHHTDGLNNIRELSEVVTVVAYPTFTHLLVNVKK